SDVIPAGATYRFVQTGGVEDDVKFWNLNDPYLYRVNTLLLNSAGEKIDVVDNRLGLRKIEYDYETGFKINGKNIEIVGMNRHQHYAYIGDAMPNSLHYKDIIQLKKLGFNTLRTAHYPHDDEILKACDELGMLVYEEAPTWIAISTHKEWFENFHESQRRMIRNHKNSPSVFIWGAGINHRGAVASAQFVSKQEDPTRLTASQSSRWTGWQNSSWTDIFGNMNYGPGIWNREEPLLAMEGPYGPEAMAPYFRDPMMPGLIGWTAHAYYTFHDPKDGDWTKRTRSGAMDAFRYPRTTRLLWYPSEMTTKPYIYVVDDWAPETKMLTIYSNAEYLTLELNGRSAGRFYPSRALKYNGLQHAPFEISTLAYADGEVVIKGWREGEQILEKAIYTPQAAQKLKLIVDKYDMDLVADGSDIMVVHAEVLDANGMRLRDFKGEISFKVDGDATIVGDGTNIRSNPVEIRLGKGSALIRAGKKAGNITVSASCGTLTPSSVTFASVPAEFDCMKADSYVINDNETLMLDLGAEGQLIQFGWTPWMPSDEKSAVAHVAPAVLDDLTAGDTPSPISAAEVHDKWQDGDYTFTIASASSAGVMRWLGEMNLIGKDNFVYGDGVLCIDEKGVDLTIEKLPVGEYTLRTYHHAPASNTNSMDPNRERLQKESIHKLPFSKSLEISVAGKVAASNVAVTSGKNQQLGSPSISEVKFSVKKSGDKVKLNYKSLDKNAGVWINGLELVRSL
ncbi:MAG: glycoside hydrolase family 2 TIM barrel-domain containing protein, partial [Rikenellaceae bacterium]